ncbi:MAG: Hemerythrin cation binding domain, partial [Labilithrix sp.]|nr:Hemerythrin cation binding domain [Labilithrix sp.]
MIVDPWEAHHQELRRVHAALLGMTHDLARTELPGRELRDRTAFVCRALLRHHEAEDTILFPRLRAEAALRAADLSFLDERDHEHQSLHLL